MGLDSFDPSCVALCDGMSLDELVFRREKACRRPVVGRSTRLEQNKFIMDHI